MTQRLFMIFLIVGLMLTALLSSGMGYAQQSEQLLPGEADDRLGVLFDTNQQLQSGLVVNVARVRAQKREIDRLTAENKMLQDKCGEKCVEPKK